MTARVIIQDGNPIWLSPSIIPSRDLSATTAVGPTFAAPTVNSNDIFVYVKAENAGTVDLGVCACSNLGRWVDAVPFAGTLGSTTGAAQSPSGLQSIQLDATLGDKLIIGPSSFPLGVAPIPAPHHRAWDWSPDGRFLAYAVSAGQIQGTGAGANSDWKLSVFALQPFTRADGTTVAPGGAIVSTQSGMVWPWTRTNFRWVGSSAVLASGPGDPEKPPLPTTTMPPPPPLEWHLLCPSAPAMANVWFLISPNPYFPVGSGGDIDKWLYLVSPCESVIAFAPNLSAQARANFVVVSLAQARLTSFTQNNVPITVMARPVYPTITTNQHTANGVVIDIGDGITAHFMTVDDPDCTAVPSAVQVAVDRVKASTLPSGNLGVLAVGQASAGPLQMGAFKWVQVPNLNGWANQGEEHWCFLAQAFTSDNTTIPRPWNGQAASPPAFPIADDNCAQRNIMIS
jgi:hypothetical protein